MPLLVSPAKSTGILKLLNSVYFAKHFPLLPPTCGGWNQQTGSQLSPARPQFHSHWALCSRKAVRLVTVRMTKWDEESSDAAVLHTKWLPTHCLEPSRNLLFNKKIDVAIYRGRLQFSFIQIPPPLHLLFVCFLAVINKGLEKRFCLFC